MEGRELLGRRTRQRRLLDDDRRLVHRIRLRGGRGQETRSPGDCGYIGAESGRITAVGSHGISRVTYVCTDRQRCFFYYAELQSAIGRE